MAALNKNGASSSAMPTNPLNPTPNPNAELNTATTNTQKQKQRSGPSKPRLSIDPASFQSVVWKPSDYGREPVQLHPPGEGEKVALLKNWREVFRSSNPAIGRPARFKKLASSSSASSRSRNQLAAARSGVIDDLKRREDSSDQTSRVSSLENLRDTDAVDSGDASNTTPPKSVSPASVNVGGARQDEEMADVDADAADKLSSNVVVEIPVPKSLSSPSPSKKRGRKRKADVIAENEAENTQNANGKENNNKRPRSKRIASNTNTTTGHDDKTRKSTGVPLRRSTRQKG